LGSRIQDTPGYYIPCLGDNSTYNWFQNIFRGKNNSNSAQAAGIAFHGAPTSPLKIQISAVSQFFLQGDLVFYYTADRRCYGQILTGSWLSISFWQLLPTSTYTTRLVSNEFQQKFAPIITAQPGFQVYASLIPDNLTSNNFFFNVFETLEQAKSANELAVEFVANGVLNNQITLVQKDTIFISFDILDKYPVCDDKESGTEEEDSGSDDDDDGAKYRGSVRGRGDGSDQGDGGDNDHDHGDGGDNYYGNGNVHNGSDDDDDEDEDGYGGYGHRYGPNQY